MKPPDKPTKKANNLFPDKVEKRTGATVSLEDSDTVALDARGKSPAYFCKKESVKVDLRLIEELKKESERLNGENLRLCLHTSPEARFHDMVILLHNDKYYRPHKHLQKDESYHLIEGITAVLIFDDQGNIEDVCILGMNGTFMFRVGSDIFHSVFPLSPTTIFHESKLGPFLGESDSIYPSWAPTNENQDEVEAFKMRMQNAIEDFKAADHE